MCGIVGVAGNLFTTERKMFQYMLKLDTVRGPHSTGVSIVDNNNEVKTYKALGTPWDFQKEFEDFKDGYCSVSTDVMIGHNRWATTGAVTVDNAHPFNFDNISGVHNGTLNSYICQRTLPNWEEYAVDSEAALRCINDNGIKETYKLLSGAWTFVWYDIKNKKVNFVRNKERPLYWATNKSGDVLFWASEEWMLREAFAKFGKKYEKATSFSTDTLYSVDVSSKNMEPVKSGVELEDYFDLFRKERSSNNYKPAQVNNYNEEQFVGRVVPFYIDNTNITKDGLIKGSSLYDKGKQTTVSIDLRYLREDEVKEVQDWLDESAYEGWFMGIINEVLDSKESASGMEFICDIMDTSVPLCWSWCDVQRTFRECEIEAAENDFECLHSYILEPVRVVPLLTERQKRKYEKQQNVKKNIFRMFG